MANGKGNWFNKMVGFTKVILRMIKAVELVSISQEIKMKFMKAALRMISLMDMASKSRKVSICILEISSTAKSQVMELWSGKTAKNMMAIGKMM